ncbi:hypothetical protein K469DRAFT_705081 [Zopfia rhizophila CBS 207.26]|uniref:Myb/SANT-like domain-containing protein n=1 Tax=Zopfia rhizophila CBS 207.26 TaxID=1314779 RepID=A0A6A6E6E6_9PEZI|nr:hypothetical protein K469DRAFT_705081 [Zopfia rhizophila CBS 207.26]
MKQALLATLVQKVVEDGLRADSGYKKDAWDAAFEAVWRVSTDKSITMKHCKTKHDTCKADYKTYSALKRLSGYSVTEAGIVVADSEAMEDYFKAHLRARKFRHKPLDFEELYQQLFDGVLATGEDAAGVDDLLAGDDSEVLKELVKRDSTVTLLPLFSESQASEETYLV